MVRHCMFARMYEIPAFFVHPLLNVYPHAWKPRPVFAKLSQNSGNMVWAEHDRENPGSSKQDAQSLGRFGD
jgi:hypothetical protein